MGNCKSRLSAIGRSLFHSRENAREKIEELRERLKESERETKQAQADTERAQAEAKRQAERVAELERELKRQREQMEFKLPDDPPLPRHQFGPRMISLCVNLARRVGFRPTVAVLKIFSRG
jgi:seryl-tRNA synthetase